MDLFEHFQCTMLARTAPWDGFVRPATPAPTRRPEGKKRIHVARGAEERATREGHEGEIMRWPEANL